jgi:hypothetical protein
MMKNAKHILLSAAVAGLLLSIVLPASAAEVDRRAHHQQQRIGQGVKSGQLTPHETAHLERNEAHVNRETQRDRAQNGGHLTSAEKAKVNRQGNRMSRQIYRDKHNNRVQ